MPKDCHHSETARGLFQGRFSPPALPPAQAWGQAAPKRQRGLVKRWASIREIGVPTARDSWSFVVSEWKFYTCVSPLGQSCARDDRSSSPREYAGCYAAHGGAAQWNSSRSRLSAIAARLAHMRCAAREPAPETARQVRLKGFVCGNCRLTNTVKSCDSGFSHKQPTQLV